jgi:hypothetical protein
MKNTKTWKNEITTARDLLDILKVFDEKWVEINADTIESRVMLFMGESDPVIWTGKTNCACGSYQLDKLKKTCSSFKTLEEVFQNAEAEKMTETKAKMREQWEQDRKNYKQYKEEEDWEQSEEEFTVNANCGQLARLTIKTRSSNERLNKVRFYQNSIFATNGHVLNFAKNVFSCDKIDIAVSASILSAICERENKITIIGKRLKIGPWTIGEKTIKKVDFADNCARGNSMPFICELDAQDFLKTAGTEAKKNKSQTGDKHVYLHVSDSIVSFCDKLEANLELNYKLLEQAIKKMNGSFSFFHKGESSYVKIAFNEQEGSIIIPVGV